MQQQHNTDSSSASAKQCVSNHALLSHWQVRPNAADECSGHLQTHDQHEQQQRGQSAGLVEVQRAKLEPHVTQSARPLTGATVVPRQSLHVLRPVPDANLPGAHAWKKQETETRSNQRLVFILEREERTSQMVWPRFFWKVPSGQGLHVLVPLPLANLP
jgi:hypothetical protein